MTTRRSLLTLATGFSLLRLRRAHALDSEIAKNEVGYQDVPRSGKVCAQCIYFIYKPAVGGVPKAAAKWSPAPSTRQAGARYGRPTPRRRSRHVIASDRQVAGAAIGAE